jgi:PAS domain S-box-containing protein
LELPVRYGAQREDGLEVLWEDSERLFCQGSRLGDDGSRNSVLVVLPVAEHPSSSIIERLTHEFGLKDELDGAWAVRPLELAREPDGTVLVLEDMGGEPLERMLGAPMEPGRFLHVAIGIAGALGKAHQRGLLHKDIKPNNILVNQASGEVRLTGFGIASRLLRERQAPEPPEFIAGTLPYMAPEQTGRMNRSIDSRSDLYALGVTFYQMVTGHLPFTASDPMEWVHCHIARRPIAPSERLKEIPNTISAIIMQLLAKTAEGRYQTAGGVERDLRRCLVDWKVRGYIDDFPLREHDMPDRLLIPEKLYGRAREVEMLLATFDRIIKNGVPEMALVSGYSGIGKSSVVNELHSALVPPRGLFASGKFDQYKRDIPYSTLAQAFQSLVRPLLSKSDTELSSWRNALLEALGPNGRLMVDVVPELKLIIGDQPPAPELPPQDAQRRFHLVFRRFIGVFARAEHPLALFLDDLQWLDTATLDLLEDLLTRSDLRYLMLIGAYRDNEVTAAHPLMRKLDAIKTAGAKVAEITLVPLVREHLGQLIADALHCKPERVLPLAQLVHEKSGGNPFFAIQFLSSLAEEGMLSFDHYAARWSWELGRIHARGYTDNVVAFMVAKLTRLPAETQTALQHLACVGNSAEITMLSIAFGTSEERVHNDLSEAVRLELVGRFKDSYKFVHDQVQEAAYSLIPETSRAPAHLRIGRLLAAQVLPEQRTEAIFDIVNQLNRGAALIDSQNERDQLAEFNLIAGKRAMASTAYASALNYLVAGAALLAEDCWARQRKLAFALELLRAECEFLTGQLTQASQRLTALSARVTEIIDLATVVSLHMEVCTTLDQTDCSIALCLEYLRHRGVEWSPHPTEEEARCEYERIWLQLGDRAIEDLIDLPMMTDPIALATMDVLTKAVVPAIFTDRNLFALVACRAVNLCLEHGNNDGSCFLYETFGMIAGACFHNYAVGFRFGKLGYDLVEQSGWHRFQARTCMTFAGLIMPWTKHIRAGQDLVRRAFDAANKIGDLTFAAYSCNQLNTKLLAAGDPLAEVEREAENGLKFAQKVRFGLVIDIIIAQLGLIRSLRGLKPKFGSFDDEQFNELRFESHLSSVPALALPECCYWIRKLQARFFAGDHLAAIHASSHAERLLWTSPSFFEMAEYHFYGALSRAASCDYDFPDQQPVHSEALTTHHQQLKLWAENCPENFENRAALVGAEIARIEGREVDAMRLYEQAIRSARDNGFVQNEAIAYELAARFYAARGFERIARVYLRDARYGYLRWGADGKARQLDELYPYLREDEPFPGHTRTIGAPVEWLDLATVIKVSQAVTSEIVLENLLDTLMRTAIEQAGAERGLLILARSTEYRIKAEATTGENQVLVQQRDKPASPAALPESVLHYVLHTRESVILDDAAAQSAFAADPYIRQRNARSVLCLPLLTPAKLIGVLYLENNLAPSVFAPARTTILKLLASHVAIALENARLYRDLAEREAKFRRLVDANIIGIFIFDFEGRILEANDAFLRILGYSRDDVAMGRMGLRDLTPPEWLDLQAQTFEEVKTTGTAQPFEKEYFRRDGSRVRVLIGGASFEEGGAEGVAFVLDLTEGKRAAEALREMETELAHANRVASLGQLTASVAHEVNQPIGAIVTNAQAALRFLDRRPPDLEEVREALASIVTAGHHAGDVVGRIRALVRKAPPRAESFNMNAAIREVIVVTRGEATRNGVLVEAQLAEYLPLVQGDRVQLQQVMLNLIINAIEAMSGVIEGPRNLLIKTARFESDSVSVSVQDSGPGFVPESLRRAFEAFYTTKPEGLGMGLSICRTIVEAHGGKLTAIANTPRGAIFQFTMPACGDSSSDRT